MRYNINQYIEVFGCKTATTNDSYPFVTWNVELLNAEKNIALYRRVKETILSIAEENSEAYVQLFVAFDFFWYEAEDYKRTQPIIPKLAEMYRKGNEARTAIKTASSIKVSTRSGKITRIGITANKTYTVPEEYYFIAAYDIEKFPELGFLLKSDWDRVELNNIKSTKEWLLFSLERENVVKGGADRNNYERAFFERIGGLYRFLRDNNLCTDDKGVFFSDKAIDFIKRLFDFSANNEKIKKYITLQKGIIPRKRL